MGLPTEPDLGHAVAVRKRIADAVEEQLHGGIEKAAAGDHIEDRIPEQVFAHLAERELREGACERAGQLFPKRERAVELRRGLFAPVRNAFFRLFKDLFPEERHRKDVRHLMAADRVDDRRRGKIVELHERAREEREPDVHRDQPEHVIERQKRQQLEVAFIMLFDLRLLADDAVAVADLIIEFLRGIGADLDVFGRAGGHDEKLRTERSRSDRVAVRRNVPGAQHGAVERAVFRDHGTAVRNAHRVQKQRRGQAQVHQKRTEARRKDRPEKLDPVEAVVEIQPDDRVVREIAERGFQRGGAGQDMRPCLAVGRFADPVALALFPKHVVRFAEHQRKKRAERQPAGLKRVELTPHEVVDGAIGTDMIIRHAILRDEKLMFSYYSLFRTRNQHISQKSDKPAFPRTSGL